MAETGRIRINLASSELEVEGSESFVKLYEDKIEVMLSRLLSVPVRVAPVSVANAVQAVPAQAGEVPDTFGEFFQRLPKNAKDVDKILAAGYFTQRNNSENFFTTREANKLLIEQGVKLSNATQSVRGNILAKKAFAIGKGKFRMSPLGNDYLNQLTAGSPNP